jgi:hypothetical protein
MNTKEWKAGKNLDFTHADAADNKVLNKFLWEDRMGDAPMPAPQHGVFPPQPDKTASAHQLRDRK